MKTKLLLALTLAGGALLLAARPTQDKPDAPPDPMAMMAGATAYLTTNENHKWLEQFLGEWDVTMRVFMMPGQPAMESAGKASVRWLMPGRWLIEESDISMFGESVKTVVITGYDNFKKKYVSTRVNSMETCIAEAEGGLDQSRTALHLYGTIDEYLTGENDKMVRYTTRVLSPDHRVLEVHDLAIGETNTKVVEIDFKRRK